MNTIQVLPEKKVNEGAARKFSFANPRGGVLVKIYHRVEKDCYDCFAVVHSERGRRELKPFAALVTATEHAQDVFCCKARSGGS